MICSECGKDSKFGYVEEDKFICDSCYTDDVSPEEWDEVFDAERGKHVG